MENPGSTSDSDLEMEADPPDWRHSLTEPELNKLSSKELKRQDVINEFFHTEKSHVRNLKVLTRVFQQPLIKKGLMPRELLNKLFANLDSVLLLHQKYNEKMKNTMKNWKRSGFPVVGDISDILTDMFLAGNSDQLLIICGEFIKNQNQAIEELKKARGRDAKLDIFISELEQSPYVRRLQIQSMLPMEHQRLMKYPLLLEHIAKYSQTSSHEHDTVVAAMEKCKEILASINHLVAEEQNRQRLQEIQSNLDTSGLDKIGPERPTYQEYRNLTTHVLLNEETMMVKLGKTKRVKQLLVVLLEDCMMLLQKQRDKYLLKFHRIQFHMGRKSLGAFHSPIIKYSTLLVKPVATDPCAFCVLNSSTYGLQIYEFIASSPSERNKWIKNITDASKSWEGILKTSDLEQQGSAQDKKDKLDLCSQSFRGLTERPLSDHGRLAELQAFGVPADALDTLEYKMAHPPQTPAPPPPRPQEVTPAGRDPQDCGLKADD